MTILAFDTSSAACSVALLEEANQHPPNIHTLQKIMPMQQGKLILPLIDELLQTAKLPLSNIKVIAFGCGPGSYTGIRIASSVAQGLGFALNLPILPVSSLAAIAQESYLAEKHTHVLVAQDARTDEVYWAIYQLDTAGHMVLVGEEQVVAPENVTLPDKSIAWVAVGDGWEKYKQRLESRLGFLPTQVLPSLFPTARAIATLAKEKYKKNEQVSAPEALPVYLR